MKSPIPPLIHTYIGKLGIRINTLRIQSIYSRHPLPHSLRALSDTFDQLHIPNMVCSLSFEQLFEIEGPFIVVAGGDEYPFHIAENVNPATQTVSLFTASGKQLTLTFDQFRSVWNGMVLMAEKNSETPEDKLLLYWLKQGAWFVDHTAIYWLAAFTVYFLMYEIVQQPGESSIPVGSVLAKAAGIAVSLIVIARTHFGSHITQRFCRSGQKSDCDEVFHAAGAKLLEWISLGELSLVYFASTMLWGIFSAHDSIGIFRLFGILTLPMIVYSLAWQIRRLKWCPLCLLIDLLLVIGLAVDIFTPQTAHVSVYPDTVNFCLFFGLCLLAVRLILRLAEQGSETTRLRFKHEILLNSDETFRHLLQQQPLETTDNDTIPYITNARQTDHTITLVMNPFCPKCAEVHKTICSLKDYRIRLVLVVNEGDERSRSTALMLITASMKYEWTEMENIIRNWYDKRQLPQDLAVNPHAEQALMKHIEYCRKIHIKGTPTVLIDNRSLPEIYDIQDLKFLL